MTYVNVTITSQLVGKLFSFHQNPHAFQFNQLAVHLVRMRYVVYLGLHVAVWCSDFNDDGGDCTKALLKSLSSEINQSV